MSNSKDADGYVVIGLRDDNGKRCTKRIHRIIAELFVNNPNNYTIINHINGIRHDNNSENLEWTTIKDNVINSNKPLSTLAKKIKYTDCNGKNINL